MTIYLIQPEHQSSISVAVGQLVAVRTEREEDAPWIARVTAVDPGKNAVDVIWMEGKYSAWTMESGQNEKRKSIG